MSANLAGQYRKPGGRTTLHVNADGAGWLSGTTVRDIGAAKVAWFLANGFRKV